MNRSLLISTLVLLLIVSPFPALATCGGGGGGGVGGITPPGAGADAQPQVYRVPWQVIGPSQTAPAADLQVLWFPTSAEEARESPLQTSRDLTLWSSQCVAMTILTPDHPQRQAQGVPTDRAAVVLAGTDGSEVARLVAEGDQLPAGEVEAMVRNELQRLEGTVDEALQQAKAKRKAGDEEAAAALYASVLARACFFPRAAKKATKQLEKMGVPVPEHKVSSFALPDLRPATTRRVLESLARGLEAERQLELSRARRHYEAARELDPADPVPLRYLAELHRHHTGDWERATDLFERILAMPSDRLSRAVALHGLGKMTIHSGQFELGLARFEASLESYPLALTYRNLAVYWNSEGQPEKSYAYTRKALALDPEDAYNQVFAATYLVTLGRPAEAAVIAARHEGMLEASYNLAAIHALRGDREQALRLLARHFYEYEQTDAVRSKEMQEARDDIVFAQLRDDPAFLRLTALADGMGAAAGFRAP